MLKYAKHNFTKKFNWILFTKQACGKTKPEAQFLCWKLVVENSFGEKSTAGSSADDVFHVIVVVIRTIIAVARFSRLRCRRRLACFLHSNFLIIVVCRDSVRRLDAFHGVSWVLHGLSIDFPFPWDFHGFSMGWRRTPLLKLEQSPSTQASTFQKHDFSIKQLPVTRF